jgi:hypothetical protein
MRTLKRVFINTTLIATGLLFVPPIVESLFDKPIKQTSAEQRPLTTQDIQTANWLKYEGNKERRDPSYKFFSFENVPQRIGNENTYVREVEQRNYGAADSLWEYPDLDGNGIVKSR